MGRVRQSYIKNLSKEIIEKFPDKVSDNYEKNKEFLKGYIESKTLRNRIAGYIVTLKKSERK